MIIAWFSCGVTSAVACKIALSLYDDVQIYYIETGSGHPDNTRFLSDCERAMEACVGATLFLIKMQNGNLKYMKM